MRKNLITAVLIAGAILLWLLSGAFSDSDGQQPANPPSIASAEPPRESSREIARVRARLSTAQMHTRTLTLRGRTENKRTVDVATEITGRLEKRLVDVGSRVDEGDLLCRLAVDDRQVAVAEAEASLRQARIEYEGSLKLNVKGLLSETAIARAEADLAAAAARLKRAQLDLDRTELRAPFSGIIEAVQMEVGDYAKAGNACVTLLDLDPMLITARVTETDTDKLTVGTPVRVTTSSGRDVLAALTFLGHQSDDATRTYRLEATVANPDYSLRSGVTATLSIVLERVPAHRVSTALFALDDAGFIGLRVLDDDNRVSFERVRIIEDGEDGTWVTGLPDQTRIITVGQEFVFSGQRVQVEMEDSELSTALTQ